MKKSLLYVWTGLICAGTLPLQITASAAPLENISTEISQMSVIQYTGSGGPRNRSEPIYKLLLRRDGTAIYVGNAVYMKRIGRYHGKVSAADFQRLSALIGKKSFENSWGTPHTTGDRSHLASEKFERIADGRKKVVVIYDTPVSSEAKRASAIFYGLLWKIRWTKVSESDQISW